MKTRLHFLCPLLLLYLGCLNSVVAVDMSLPANVHVYVTDENAKPVAGAQVKLADTDDPAINSEQATDTAGRAELRIYRRIGLCG